MEHTYPIETIRHSLAHVMASAIKHLYGDGVQFGIGPVIENGFYYDFDFENAGNAKLSSQDFPKIEAKMREIIAQKLDFVRSELSITDAIARFETAKQSYKSELLKDLQTRGTTKIVSKEEQTTLGESVESVSLYQTGNFHDLCQGPHVANTSDLSPYFKLMSVAGAYWRGNEKNPMMQRIYAVAFETKEALEKYLYILEEAQKRDHRKLGQELDLFIFSDLVGAGLPLWTPKGTQIRSLLDEFVWSIRQKYGYLRVEIPHIAKKDLYETSGHWDKFKEELFRMKTREGHEFALKPMNCPHHTQIYARKTWSYRDLPQRYANTTMIYRDEQTGELHGLSRVRAITQDDSHLFCRRSHVQDEIRACWNIVEEFYTVFGFSLQPRLSLHDPEKAENYLGAHEEWLEAEQILRDIAKEKKMVPVEAVGEAAFYGPKLDFLAKDSLGREWQVATIQLDFNMPGRFHLVCINEKGEQETVQMLHVAIMGAIERFLAILIEHLSGAFPLWLAPVQIQVIPVSDKHNAHCLGLAQELQKQGLRAEVDTASESVGKKIRNAEKMKIPYMLVAGDKEVESQNLIIRKRGEKETFELSKSLFIERVQDEIQKKVL